MIVVGIVGRIAAGKSTVARLLADLGAEVLDADRIAHAVLDEPDVRQELAAQFGGAVLDEAGRVRRPALAALVFGPAAIHQAALERLEAIVHPRVRQRIEAQLEAIAAADAAAVVVLDVPLLIQAGWDTLCDRLVLVECEESERQRRLEARGWSDADRAAREQAWNRHYSEPDPEKTVRVDASAGEAYTQGQVGRFWTTLPRA